jgi:hypothetical protein
MAAGSEWGVTRISPASWTLEGFYSAMKEDLVAARAKLRVSFLHIKIRRLWCYISAVILRLRKKPRLGTRRVLGRIMKPVTPLVSDPWPH